VAGIGLGQLPLLEQRVAQRRAVFERYRKGFEDLPGIEPQPEAHSSGQWPVGSGQQRNVESMGAEAGGQRSVVGGTRAESSGQSSGRIEPGVEIANRKSQIANSRHTRWLSCFLIDEARFGMSAGELIRFLDSANVESRPVWKPMQTQKLYRGYECIGGQVAEDLNRRGICLPSSSCLTEEEQQFVIERVREAHFASRR